MNTLPRAITAQVFVDSSSYAAFRRHWSTLMNSDRKHELSAAHHLLYLALLGKDWRKGFTPIANRRKLENGAFGGWGLLRALCSLHSQVYEQWLLAPFEGLVTPEMLQFVRGMLPRSNPYTYRSDSFANGAFPFEAYCVPESLLVAAAGEDRSHA